tara:strand:- start:31267 stop:32286 length:1020 start_codon:yes stop_codon:yes gene_type:complete
MHSTSAGIFSENKLLIYLTDPTSHQSGGQMANIGDQIIKDAIVDNIVPDGVSPNWLPLDVAQIPGSPNDKTKLVLAGANVISNNPFINKNAWRPRLRDYKKIDSVCLFGVGWWKYQSAPNRLTQSFYHRFLASLPVLHSVRDSYSEQMLRQCGIDNVLNTGCPTMWKLPDLMRFDNGKASGVVFTLTDYAKNPEMDKWLIEYLLAEYPQVYFFPQGIGDVAYLNQLRPRGMESIQTIAATLEAYNDLLDTTVVDYVGVRLHGGIRAMQKGRRAIVVSVDNRAESIAKDTGLLAAARDELPEQLPPLVSQQFTVELTLNRENIQQFMVNFRANFNLARLI